MRPIVDTRMTGNCKVGRIDNATQLDLGQAPIDKLAVVYISKVGCVHNLRTIGQPTVFTVNIFLEGSTHNIVAILELLFPVRSMVFE